MMVSTKCKCQSKLWSTVRYGMLMTESSQGHLVRNEMLIPKVRHTHLPPPADPVPEGALVLSHEKQQKVKGLAGAAKVPGMSMAGMTEQLPSDLTPGDGHRVPFDVTPVERGEVQCKLCPYKFYNTSRLLIHMRKHTKSRFKCDTCHKQYATNAGLR